MTSRPRRLPARAPGSLALAAVAAALLVGCTPEPAPVATTPPPVVEGPVQLTPESTTEEARVVFDGTAQAVLAQGAGGDGRAVVDALVAAGFDKAAMQVTPDATWTGRAADSLQFAVRWGDDCLVGQIAGDAYAAQTAPVLGTGACLIGTTRAIDW